MELTVVQREGNQTWLRDFLGKITSDVSNSSKPVDFKLILSAFFENIQVDYTLDKKMLENEEKLLSEITIIRENLSKLLVKKIIVDYLSLLSEKNLLGKFGMNLAFDFYGSGILVWIETTVEDDEFEKAISSIDLVINKKYSSQKIELRSVVFDKSYDFCFPPQYVKS